MAMGKIQVLVVDDSVVMRRLIGSVLEGHPQIEIAGVAADGKIAVAKVRQRRPDLITLDVEMPEMDGLTALTEIRRIDPKIPVIMFSTLTQRGAVQTVDALARGAADYVPKPANVGSVEESIERLRGELIPKILACARPVGAASPHCAAALAPQTAAAAPRLPAARRRLHAPSAVIAITASTGGPNALESLLRQLPADLGVPVVAVQHMPPVFTGLLARRLNDNCALSVVEGAEGQLVTPGCVYLAPGGKHMEARRVGDRVTAHLHEGAPENSCRPAADVLFRSVAEVWGERALAVVLTGMGQDGMRGARAISERGGGVIAQDRESSVVWGMPGSVVETGLAEEVLPLDQIAPAILTRLKKEPARALIQ
jgi:two-component system, chemotaxis family, protein-glutamate methylesterase/glutaminase